jgi:glycerol kinase
MTKDLVLAIDQGTTGTTALLVDAQLSVIAKVNREFRQIFPKPGWVEHDLEDIWASVEGTVAEVLDASGVDSSRIAALGITNQRETVGLWDRATGEAPCNAIVWQCRRTAARCESLRAGGHLELIRERTGLLLDPYFSGTKLGWLLDEVPGAREKARVGDLLAGTIDSFLVWKLTGGEAHVTDVTNASRTLLFGLADRRWDPELLDVFGVPAGCLPQIRSSSEVYGYTKGVAGLPDGIPIAGMAGDQHAALFGQACFQPGDVKCTYGTGAFIVLHTGTEIVRSSHDLLTTVAWQLGPEAPMEYAMEGSVFSAGSAVQWLRDGLRIIDVAPEVEPLAASVPDSGEVVFVPALTGLGAPHWRAGARGIITGITRGTGRAELARATLEGIALQCHDVIEALRSDSTRPMGDIRVDGGAAANDLLMQIQADLAGRPVLRPSMLETTAAGAAFLAGLAVGLFPSKDAIQAVWREERRFTPSADRRPAERLLQKWKAAVPKA